MDTIFLINGDESYVTPHKPVTQGKTYLLYTLRGEGAVAYDGRQYAAKPNTFIFMQPTRDFSYRCKEDKWEFWWFEFFGTPPFTPDVFAVFFPNQLVLTLMGKSLQYAKNGDWDIASSLFLSLTKVLVRGANRSERAIYQERMVSAMEDYIGENMHTVTVRELGEVFCMEERTLRNTFLRGTGMSPKQVIMKIRMEHAAYLLISTMLTIDEVARQVGFANQYHFSKAFKDFHEITPTRYRKMPPGW